MQLIKMMIKSKMLKPSKKKAEKPKPANFMITSKRNMKKKAKLMSSKVLFSLSS